MTLSFISSSCKSIIIVSRLYEKASSSTSVGEDKLVVEISMPIHIFSKDLSGYVEMDRVAGASITTKISVRVIKYQRIFQVMLKWIKYQKSKIVCLNLDINLT